jgi:SAM-dependent methyltransferase
MKEIVSKFFKIILILVKRIIFYSKKKRIKKDFKNYIARMKSDHPFLNFPKRIVGDCTSSPYEYFDYYDGYAFWLARKLREMGDNKNILDVGNTKQSNAFNSLANKVTACLLMPCHDSLSNVRYLIHDVAEKLPFADSSFDVFTSAVSVQLFGLGRYGDKLDPDSLINFVKELERVLKPNSDLIISNTFGYNCLDFNNHYVFDLPTLQNIFSPWKLIDYLIDNGSRVKPHPYSERYTKDLSIDDYFLGDYRVIFLHFKRVNR